MAVPLKARSTVTSLPLAALRVAVTVAEPAASAMGEPVTVRVTEGVGSSSAMFTVAEEGDPTVYAASELMVRMTVSLGSSSASSMGVTVTVFVADPARIVALVPMDV